MEICTERLVLTHWKDSDEHLLYQLNHNPEVMHYFSHALSKQQNHDFFIQICARFKQYGYGVYKVMLKENNQFIGFVGFNHPEYTLPFACSVEIAWRLLPHYWHRGFAFEAASTLLNYGFDVLKFQEVMAFATKKNQPSWTLMQRLGMQFQCNFLHPLFEADHPLVKHVLYSIANPDSRHVKIS